jgi:DNA-directed RNA polymerase subunit N (RpoN/RPB10)
VYLCGDDDGMSDAVERLSIYLHLAHASQLRGRLHVRDRLLILAGVIAAENKLTRIAACCRHRVLQHNPQHLLGRWPTLSEALADADFAHFLRHLYRRYPDERAERMLVTLGIERGCERATYFSDEEYASSLLRVPFTALEQFGPGENP